MLLVLLVAVPAVLGLVAFFVEDVRLDLVLLIAASAIHLVLTIGLWLGLPAEGVGLLLGLDVPGHLFLTITSALFVVASFYSIPYLLAESHHEQTASHLFVPCLLWFLSAMTLVTLSQHLALMWAAVEATTLASAPLIYFYKKREALEATWKYLLICSVGIALALLGTFFLGIAASARPGESPELALSSLLGVAPQLSRAWLKAAFVLALVGYGTKMGLAPLHTWLPDAHSQAPSPVSALLSGTLLNCAFLGILRFYQIVLASGDAAFARTLLVVFGLLSIGVAAAFLVGQRDFKRLFAYSSVENMGVIAVGVGLGGAATYGAMLHAVNHSLCKAGLFLLAGNVLRSYGTTDARTVRGVLRHLPATGLLLTIGLLAIGGSPPFGPFVSEFLIFQSAIGDTKIGIAVLFGALLALAFLGMAGVLLSMLQGRSDASRPTREPVLSVAAPLVLSASVLVLGLYIPPQLSGVLRDAARILGGG